MPKLPTESPAMPKQSSMIPPDGYELFFNDLKKRIGTARVKAALAVNKELILLYWHIGTEILAKQSEEGWGSKVIDQLAKDLKRSFPDMTGFSPQTLNICGLLQKHGQRANCAAACCTNSLVP